MLYIFYFNKFRITTVGIKTILCYADKKITWLYSATLFFIQIVLANCFMFSKHFIHNRDSAPDSD
ncbi:hypothetical protein SAMN05216357_10544 [Porphyromonadaceae bacterium KH3CP3RA]|nr:hypothetical protein SAMN05216357_10544 [Porphyromonadaceae bacterium KH3CP3RA]